MKFSIWEYRNLKKVETDSEICFVDHILDATMKHVPIGFLCILIQYMIDIIFSFSVTLKPKRSVFSIFCIFIYYPITTFISFAVSHSISLQHKTVYIK